MASLVDVFLYAWKNLRTTKLRSYLTIIGVVIGVMALVTVTAISDGVQDDIKDQLAAFGTDKMFIVPIDITSGSSRSFASGFSQGATSGKLFQKDADAIAAIPGVKSIARMVYGRTSVEFKKKAITATIYGSDASFLDQWDNYMEIESGRMYKDSETGVVLLGNDAANEMFGKDQIAVGNILVINGNDYRVVGILKKIGTSLSTADDSSIYIPFEDGKEEFKSQLSKNEIQFISLQISEGYEVNSIKDAIESKLIAYHKVKSDEKDFTVVTSDVINETIGSVISALGIFLFFITMIATLVGAVGIMNTMFMGVLERVREIGVLKAVGATQNDILLIFVSEAAILGFIGGTIGLAIGAMILFIAGQFGVPYSLSPRIILFAFIFSAFVGSVAGFIPARQAARLDPVDALRYE